jgi:hypothetical protein
MKRIFVSSVIAIGLLAPVLPAPGFAQSNDNDYTPLNSRIRHDKQFPLEPRPNFVPLEKMGKVERDWMHSMANQLAKCLYRRSNEAALDFLDKTDFGFVNFKQIGLDDAKALRIYGFQDCLNRVADSNSSSVAVQFHASNLRQWMLQAAYFGRYPIGPTWLKPGYVIGPRKFPLSQGNAGVMMPMDFADCVVAADPYNADYFFRTVAGSAEEKEALNGLTPSLGPCLPQGMRIQLDPRALRVWIGEGLWQAANHSGPAPDDAPKAPG